MADLTARQALKLAVGAIVSEDSPELVVGIAFDVLMAEARAISSDDSTLDEKSRVQLEYAHVHRIEALKALIEEHMSVSWAGATP